MFVVTVVMAFASLSKVPAARWQFSGPKGKPVDRVLVAWSYQGTRFNFVHSVTYEKPGGVADLKNGGVLKLGGFFELHRPLDGGLEPWIEIVYVPELHNAFGPIGKSSDVETANRKLEVENHRIVITDLVDDPQSWTRSLDTVCSFVVAELSAKEAMTAERKRDLAVWAGVLLVDYQKFLERYAEVKRAIPADPPFWRGLPEAEIVERRKSMIERIAREPLWGPYMERMWKNNIVHLRALAKDQEN